MTNKVEIEITKLEEFKSSLERLNKHMKWVHEDNESLRQENKELKGKVSLMRCCENCMHQQGYDGCNLLENCEHLKLWESIYDSKKRR